MSKIDKLKLTSLDFEGKELELTGEFVSRVFERNIINIFNGDLDLCKTEIEKSMREKSVVVYNPDRKYVGQKWCLIELPKLGLTKIPVAETENKIILITIANPVTDVRCKEAFYGNK